MTVSPLPLWIHKSIYVFYKWCTSRSLKCSVRRNILTLHTKVEQTKLIGALNRTACSRTVRVCLTKDVVSESTASVEMATDLHYVLKSWPLGGLQDTLPDVALTECLCRKSRDWAKAFLLQWVESSSLHSKHLPQWQPQENWYHRNMCRIPSLRYSCSAVVIKYIFN